MGDAIPTAQYLRVLQQLIEISGDSAHDVKEIQDIIRYLRFRFASDAHKMIRKSSVKHPTISQPGGSKMFDGKTMQTAGTCETSSNSNDSKNKIENLHRAFSIQLQNAINLATLDSMHI